MSPNCRLLAWLSGLLAAMVTGCALIPVPALQDTVVSGRPVAEDDLRAIVSNREDSKAVKARLGKPVADFGPGRVHVYAWTVNKGRLVWFAGGYSVGVGGIEPWAVSHLFMVAFDSDGKALKAGSSEFKPFQTLAKQVHDWLSFVGLDARVFSRRIGQPTGDEALLVVYRPSSSPCSFPTHDSGAFKPSVDVDGTVVGDLGRGEYLAIGIEAGARAVTIDPVPHYRFAGQEDNAFVQRVRGLRIPATVQIAGDANRPVYVETYLCTGTGEIRMHAAVRDEPTALQSIRALRPAW